MIFSCVRCLTLAGAVWLFVPVVGFSQMITAHRGASFDAPENTSAAFKLAWQQHADAIEGDFYLTSDDQIVCIHDKDTFRTTGVKKTVEQSTLRELRDLDYGKWKSPSFAGEPIPTFQEVLASVPLGKRFVIELKSPAKIVPYLAGEIAKASPPLSSLLVISFDRNTISQCKRLLPDVEAHWLTSFEQDPAGTWSPTAERIADTMRSIGADGVGLEANNEVVNADFVKSLTAHGCKTFHVWTVDSVEDAARFQTLGAVGITTNRPGLIRTAISAAIPGT